MKQRRFLLSLSFALLIPSLAQAGFYVRPRVGATFPAGDGDPAYSVGAAAGYQWNRYLATELSYSRLIGTGTTPDGDLIRGEGILSYPLPVVTPFATAGVGSSHFGDWDAMMLFGGGLSLHALHPFYLDAGVSYAAVFGGSDFFEPYAAVGIGF